MIRRRRLSVSGFATAALLMAVPTGTARGQADQPAPLDDEIKFTLSVRVEQHLTTDVDGGGELEVSRIPFRLETENDLTDDLTLKLILGYELNLYDFSGASGLGVDPWDDVHVLDLAGQLQWAVRDDWFIFGGPIVRFARETDASWDDAVMGGAVFGATHVFSKTLVLGAGVGVISQLEDNALVFPVLVIDWQINDNLRLVSQGRVGSLGALGLELVYDLGSGWEVAGGFQYEQRRFRLDSSRADAPKGIGEETTLPLWARLSYEINENIGLDLYVGVASGELELQDSGGNGVASADYDPGGFIGFSARASF